MTVYLTLEAARKDPALQKLLLDRTVTKYVYDLKATDVYCHRFDLEMTGPYIDLLLAAYTLDTSSNTAPEAILSLYGANFSLEDEPTLFATGKPNYAGQVAYFMPRLWNKIEAELHIKDSLAIFYDLEMPLALVLAKMEREGFPVDGRLLGQIGSTFRQKLDQVTKRIYETAGMSSTLPRPTGGRRFCL
jgi:DNA polymerase-1